jgi:hypothetical protein
MSPILVVHDVALSCAAELPWLLVASWKTREVFKDSIIARLSRHTVGARLTTNRPRGWLHMGCCQTR